MLRFTVLSPFIFYHSFFLFLFLELCCYCELTLKSAQNSNQIMTKNGEKQCEKCVNTIYIQILLTSRSDRCDLLLNGGVQIEVWSSVVNPRRMFTNAYMNQFLKQALDSKIASSVECVINRVMTFLILTRKSSKLT